MNAAELSEVYDELIAIKEAHYLVPRIGKMGQEKDQVIFYLPRAPGMSSDHLLTLTSDAGYYTTAKAWPGLHTRRLDPKSEQDRIRLHVATAMAVQYIPGRVIIDLGGKLT